MIKIEMLRCFRAVVDHGSLAQAADALGRTSSAVSMMLKQFEDHIGAPLFETTRKSKLTPLGAAIHSEARRELDHFDVAISTIESLARSRLGIVRLAVTPSVAVTIMPPIIQQFAADHPDVQIDLRDMESSAVLEVMAKERADIGIGSFPGTEALSPTELYSDTFGVVCRKDHPLVAIADGLTWNQLASYTFIANRLCDMIQDVDFRPIFSASRIMAPNTASLLGLVRAGVGLTVLPSRAIFHHHHDLTFLPVQNSTTARTVHMITQPKNRLLPATKALVALVHTAKDSGAFHAHTP